MGERAHRRPRPSAPVAGRKAAVALVLAAAGLLFATSAQTSQGTDLRSDTSDLPSLVRQRSQAVQARSLQVAALRAEVDRLSRSVPVAGGPGAGRPADALDDAALGAAAGTTAVRGPGVTVTLDDAPRDGTPPAGAAPDDLVVHQQDVEGVVNALWVGGAEAMTIMDQRIVSTSAVRCVGNVLVLQGRTYSPPYAISAIGDPARLQAALAASAQISIYREYVDAYGLGYDAAVSDDLLLGAFDGSLTLTHARVAGAAA